MSINNVNNMNKADLVKLALEKKGKGAQAPQKPQWMLPTGSIFVTGKTAQAAGTPNPAPTIADLNTEKSVFDKPQTRGGVKGENGTEESPKDIKTIDNASDGKKAAGEADSQQKDVKNKTTEVQQDQKKVEKSDRDSVKLGATIKKDQKSFELNMKKNEKLVQDNNLKIQKAAEGIDEAQLEIDTMQSELDTLMSAQGSSQSIYARKGAAGGDDSKIKDLQSRIGAKTTIMDAHGKQIYTLQRSSSRTMKSMTQMSNAQVKTSKMNQKNLQTQETNAQKIIKIADKVDQISGTVAQVGQMVNYAGKGLVLLGASMTWAAGAGAALVAAGQVMQKVGTVTELVGNYGQAAANITKTAAYAADGNIMGAISSAGAAMMSGVSAAKGTKDIGKSMEAINKQADGATQKLAAGVAAKETVKNAPAEQLNGMTQKQATKATKAQLMNDMANTEGLEGKSWKELKGNLTNGADGNISKAQGALSDSADLFAEAKTTATNSLEKSGKKITNKKVSKAANKIVNNHIAGNAGTEAVKAGKNNTFDTMETIGKSLQTAAAGFTPQTQTAGTGKKTVKPHRYDYRTQQIIAQNNKQRAFIAGRYA